MAVDVIARAVAGGRVPITAYDMAVAGGYTGTKEEFEADMGNSGTNATNAANSAAAAAASAAEASGVADDIAQYKTDTMTAPANISAGEYILAAGTLYVATANIASGSTLTPNGNVTQVTVGEELTEVIASNAQKADANGTSPNLTAGNALQLVSTVGVEDQVPYNFRTSGGAADIGDRETDMVVGGTLAWNQLVQIPLSSKSKTENGVTYVDNRDGSYTVSTTAEGATATTDLVFANSACVAGHSVLIAGIPTGGSNSTWCLRDGWDGTNKYSDGIKTITNAGGQIGVQIRVFSGAIITTPITFRPQIFDLTQMFGATVADYIYSLEQANAGDGVAWFKKLFPNDYYAYDAGTLRSVQTSAHKMVGFNAFDKNASDVTLGKYLDDDGSEKNNDVYNITGYIPVVGGQTYYFADTMGSSANRNLVWYDSAKNIISVHRTPYTGSNTNINVAPLNAMYVRVSVAAATKWNTYVVNLSWDGERDGEYEPYQAWNYPLDDSLTLRGIPKLDANNKLRYDGDTYASDGMVTRRYGIVDMGTLTWTANSSYGFYANIPDAKKNTNNSIPGNLICSKLPTVSYNDALVIYASETKAPFVAWKRQNIETRGVIAYDNASTTASEFTTAMSGVMLVYELDTPTTETAAPYTGIQVVSDWGTEEYTDSAVIAGLRDVAIPVGHETLYQSNLRSKLEMAPNSPSSGDGLYAVRQTHGANAYELLVFPDELPPYPSADGTFVLKVTVADGTPTVSWVSE